MWKPPLRSFWAEPWYTVRLCKILQLKVVAMSSQVRWVTDLSQETGRRSKPVEDGSSWDSWPCVEVSRHEEERVCALLSAAAQSHWWCWERYGWGEEMGIKWKVPQEINSARGRWCVNTFPGFLVARQRHCASPSRRWTWTQKQCNSTAAQEQITSDSIILISLHYTCTCT